MDEKYVIFSNGEDCILVKVFCDCNTGAIKTNKRNGN